MHCTYGECVNWQCKDNQWLPQTVLYTLSQIKLSESLTSYIHNVIVITLSTTNELGGI